MRIDDLISRIAHELADVRVPIKQAILANNLLPLQQAAAIRVNTKAEADLMLDVYRHNLIPFLYHSRRISFLALVCSPPNRTFS